MTAIDVPRATSDRVGVRLLVGVQAVFWALYFVGVGGLLLVAGIRYGGFGFYPFGAGDVRDPKDVFGLGEVAGGIVHLPLVVTVLFAVWVSAILTVAGLIRLRRKPFSAVLAISTALCAAAGIIQLTPFGSLLWTWMLD